MNNLTELVFILDKSGSMYGLESDTIGGFNGVLEKQRKLEGKVLVTTALFDSHYELLHDRIDLMGISNITEEDYEPGGSTALLDAVGRTISKIKKAQDHTKPEQRPAHTLVTIITDGAENSSREYSKGQIKKMIEKQRAAGWEFVYMGANVDAFSEAESIGISRKYSVNYMPDGEGVKLSYDAVSEMAYCVRTNEDTSDWSERNNKDYEKRSRRRSK